MNNICADIIAYIINDIDFISANNFLLTCKLLYEYINNKYVVHALQRIIITTQPTLVKMHYNISNPRVVLKLADSNKNIKSINGNITNFDNKIKDIVNYENISIILQKKDNITIIDELNKDCIYKDKGCSSSNENIVQVAISKNYMVYITKYCDAFLINNTNKETNFISAKFYINSHPTEYYLIKKVVCNRSKVYMITIDGYIVAYNYSLGLHKVKLIKYNKTLFPIFIDIITAQDWYDGFFALDENHVVWATNRNNELCPFYSLNVPIKNDMIYAKKIFGGYNQCFIVNDDDNCYVFDYASKYYYCKLSAVYNIPNIKNITQSNTHTIYIDNNETLFTNQYNNDNKVVIVNYYKQPANFKFKKIMAGNNKIWFINQDQYDINLTKEQIRDIIYDHHMRI